MGEAVWQSHGGQVDGALQLDGIDDYIDTHFELNPAETVFSVIAWIKGGAPGQARRYHGLVDLGSLGKTLARKKPYQFGRAFCGLS